MSKRFALVVALAATLVMSLVMGAMAADPHLATAIRSLSNPYHAAWARGSEMFAEEAGMLDQHTVLLSEGSSQKQVSDIRALVARTGGNVVFSIDPNEAPDAVAIANILEAAGVYFVTWWNKPEDVSVMDYPHWVSHITFDNVASGYRTAVELFKSFETPFEGEIVAIQGMLANTPAIERFQGLQLALQEYPGVKLLDAQPADWQRALGFTVASNMLVAHPNIDGIWAANDDMAMGALEALRARGLVGKVKVSGVDAIPEMIDAIRRGEAVATVASDAMWQGGIGLSLAVQAARGEIDVASLPENKREWVADSILITQDNIEWYVENYVEGTPEYDWSDPYARWLRGINE